VPFIITLIYYALCAYTVVFLAINFLKTRDWQKAALQVVVILPFLLRVLRLK
jgi:hypothetical protein